MKKIAIIVAGGKGVRMGNDVPKQFIPLPLNKEGKSQGKPILMLSIDKFAPLVDSIVVVLPPEHIQYWKELCVKYNFNTPHIIKEGGETRFHSVLSGLEDVEENSLVAIHDAVRPFVADDVITELFNTAIQTGSAIPYIDMVDSIRQTNRERTESIQVDRSRFIRIQTPQVFHSKLIKEAYSKGYEEDFTDDASVYERRIKKEISLVKGNTENIKITDIMDLRLAEIILNK